MLCLFFSSDRCGAVSGAVLASIYIQSQVCCDSVSHQVCAIQSQLCCTKDRLEQVPSAACRFFTQARTFSCIFISTVTVHCRPTSPTASTKHNALSYPYRLFLHLRPCSSDYRFYMTGLKTLKAPLYPTQFSSTSSVSLSTPPTAPHIRHAIGHILRP